jgi:hypothetical protein
MRCLEDRRFTAVWRKPVWVLSGIGKGGLQAVDPGIFKLLKVDLKILKANNE